MVGWLLWDPPCSPAGGPACGCPRRPRTPLRDGTPRSLRALCLQGSAKHRPTLPRQCALWEGLGVGAARVLSWPPPWAQPGFFFPPNASGGHAPAFFFFSFLTCGPRMPGRSLSGCRCIACPPAPSRGSCGVGGPGVRVSGIGPSVGRCQRSRATGVAREGGYPQWCECRGVQHVLWQWCSLTVLQRGPRSQKKPVAGRCLPHSARWGDTPNGVLCPQAMPQSMAGGPWQGSLVPQPVGQGVEPVQTPWDPKVGDLGAVWPSLPSPVPCPLSAPRWALQVAGQGSRRCTAPGSRAGGGWPQAAPYQPAGQGARQRAPNWAVSPLSRLHTIWLVAGDWWIAPRGFGLPWRAGPNMVGKACAPDPGSGLGPHGSRGPEGAGWWACG
jgi:hypothetical protein